MPSKKALDKVAKDSSSSAVRRGSKEAEGDQARSVTSGGAPVAEPTDAVAAAAAIETAVETGTIRDVPHVGAAPPSTPVPNVQAEATHASSAPEDVRDGAVAEPNT